MTTVAIAPTPILQFLNNQGTPCVGGTVLTQVGGVNYATYQDAAGTIPLPNPIPLNSRGEISNASGQSCELFLDTSVIYSFTLFDAAGNQLNQASSVSASVPATTFLAFVASLASSIGTSLIGFILGLPGAVQSTLQTFLRNLPVTPQGFGAVGDDVTDDTAAFRAAFATGRNVRIPKPPVAYNITGNLPLAGAFQKIYGEGWDAQINFRMATPGPGITTSNSSGWQVFENLSMTGVSNCTAVISVGSAELKFNRVQIRPLTTGSVGISQQDENTGTGTFVFGMRVEDSLIHGSFTTGSRGVRMGLNSQTASFINTVIENFETGVSIERNTDSVVFEGCTFETMMSTGYGIDMRSVASTSTYKAISITGTHFEDVYGAVCWGTTGGTGATYTDHEYHGNFFSGHSGGTTYFLTVNGTCGAGCTNNRIEFNDATDASGATQVTFFFNLNDVNGAASLVSKKGNTVGAGAWATGSQSVYAYTVRWVNPFFGAVPTTGSSFASTSQTRVECAAGMASYSLAIPWYAGEYLESIQWVFLPTGSTPQVTGALTSGNSDVTATVATTGVQTGTSGSKKLITLAINTIPTPGLNYWMLQTHALNGGTTAFDYPFAMYLRQ